MLPDSIIFKNVNISIISVQVIRWTSSAMDMHKSQFPFILLFYKDFPRSWEQSMLRNEEGSWEVILPLS